MTDGVELRLVLASFRMAEEHDDVSDLRDVEIHGRHTLRVVATIPVRSNELLRRLDVYAGDAMLASVPFAIGAGHWVWVEDEPEGEADE